MSRFSSLFLGVVIYLLFFVTFLLFAAFVGNLPGTPLSVDAGPATPTGVAIVIDLLLVALFGIQHSVMARPKFKAAWTRIVPHALERSVYVLAATLALIVLMAFWRPIPAVVWSVESAAGQAVLWTLFGFGWALVLASTFLLNHFELFGLQQVWHNLRGHGAPPPTFREPMFYRWVRHPLYLGFLFALWAIPVMTAGHLLLAGGLTAYILIAIRYEERDLIAVLGRDYAEYRTRVGMLLPRMRRGA